MTSTGPYPRIIIAGIGPRGILFHTSYIAQTLSKLWCGAYVDRTVVTHDFYDYHEKDSGPGNAFQIISDGNLNTGLPGPITLEKNGLTPHECLIIDRLTDLAGRYKEYMANNDAMAPANLQNTNFATALLVSHASQSHGLDTSIACGPRNVVGHIMQSMCDEATELARIYIPWLKIGFHYGVEIIHVDVKDLERPVIAVRKKSTEHETTLHECDLFIKATGTTWEVPVTGRVREKAYVGIPQHHALRNHIMNIRKLDEEGMIIPGSRILISGASLSALDHLGLLLSMTKIARIDPAAQNGFRIDEEEARKYPQLITLFSPSQDGLPPPRLNETTREFENPHSSLVTPEMLFAVRLQRDIDPFATYLRLAQLFTALTCKVLPKHIQPELTAIKSFEAMIAEAKAHARMAAEPTETEFLQRYLADLFFPRPLKLSFDCAQTAQLLCQEPWAAFRSMSYTATHHMEPNSLLGAEYIHAHKSVMRHITSMPYILHLLLGQLYELGVVKWQEGHYQDVGFSCDENHFQFKSANYDVFIASRVITCKTDVIWKSLSYQLGHANSRKLVFSKGRFLQSHEGAFAHVIELGLPGHGEIIDGQCYKARWNDTNSYHGAHDLMPKVAKLISLFERVASAKLKNPIKWILQQYEKSLPSSIDFDTTLQARFREPFIRLVQFLLIAEISEDLSETGSQFSSRVLEGLKGGYDHFATASLREIGYRLTWRMGWLYTNTRAMAFHPFSLGEFADISVDFTNQQIDLIDAQLSRFQNAQANNQATWETI